ncbi:hypothetical protein [Mesorhizobium sp. M0814]|uniref:hypothetical protein n=1 Tax=unclassified Mesorhizobium TaxID=325217 RepID=UPI0033387969
MVLVCVRCLVRVMRIGRALYPEQSRDWLFPAESERGHVIEHKEKRSDLSKWGNDLRQTFRTIAQAAGVAELDVHLLMNHSIPGVNAGYITPNKLLKRSPATAIGSNLTSDARSWAVARESNEASRLARPSQQASAF